MKKILAACLLLLAVLPLFAMKTLPFSGPERRAALEKLYGKVAIVDAGGDADYFVAVVPQSEADLCVLCTDRPNSPFQWQFVPVGQEDFRISIVKFGTIHFRVAFVNRGSEGVRYVP